MKTNTLPNPPVRSPKTVTPSTEAPTTEMEVKTTEDTNPDPITGAPGAHPVGTGVGAAAAGTAGAAIGTMAGGPIGGVIGTAVGAIVGGLAGKGVAEAIDPTAEDAYWREAHKHEPYFNERYTYDDYRPAYRVGYGTYPEYVKLGRTWDESESDLKKEYDATKGSSQLEWDEARPAIRAAWQRAETGKRELPFDKPVG